MKPKYRQPYSINEYRLENPTLEYHLKMKQHHREKYKSKYLDSKLTKRLCIKNQKKDSIII